MQTFLTLLGGINIPMLSEGYQIGLDWLGQFAKTIIESVGIIGVGIICFTLILKAITLPFDTYQRYTSRKQTLIMRDMKDDLEKLQKQYANDKTMYQQKMQELYKKNGYSVFSACLPTIISFVVIIVAFQGFNAYSKYSNLDFFVEMSQTYNATILQNGTEGIDYTLLRDEEENISVDGSQYTLCYVDAEGNEKTHKVALGDSFEEEGCEYAFSENGNIQYYLTVMPLSQEKFIYYGYSLEATSVTREYFIDQTRLLGYLSTNDVQAYDEITSAEDQENACLNYVKKIGADSAKQWYDNNRANFLWVENVWYSDVAWTHPIPENYATFSKNFGNVTVTFADGSQNTFQNIFTESNYEDLTASLQAEKSMPNGYFGLIIGSILLMVLSQFVMMRSQKETSQYQTADGQGSKTQKYMLIIMPLIYAIFAFTYSAAFTIYMFISSLVSLIVTLLSNLILGIIFRRKEEKKIIAQTGYKPQWMIERDQKQKKTKKDDKGKSPKK